MNYKNYIYSPCKCALIKYIKKKKKDSVKMGKRNIAILSLRRHKVNKIIRTKAETKDMRYTRIIKIE